MAWDWIQGGKQAVKQRLHDTLNERINAKGNDQLLNKRKFYSNEYSDYGGERSGYDKDIATQTEIYTPFEDDGSGLKNRYNSKRENGYENWTKKKSRLAEIARKKYNDAQSIIDDYNYGMGYKSPTIRYPDEESYINDYINGYSADPAEVVGGKWGKKPDSKTQKAESVAKKANEILLKYFK